MVQPPSSRQPLVRKGQRVLVKSSQGSGVDCVLVDIDYSRNCIWVRLPTNRVIELAWDSKQGLYSGRWSTMTFTVSATGD